MIRTSCSRLGMLALAAILYLGACAPTTTAAPFIPPNAQALPSATAEPSPTTATHQFTLPATPSPAATVLPPTPTTEACFNNLAFVQDITVPDGSLIQPGGIVEKAWLVTNSGTCDWGSEYRMKLTGGEAFNSPTAVALYPARAGTQAILRIMFTAPLLPGTYEATWNAFAPDGTVFGDPFYLQILVTGQQ
jgi:hypothetical protein